MLIRFFYALRKAGLKPSLQQFLTLAEALEKGLHGQTLGGFYNLARCTLISDVTDFDRFDLVFSAFFAGVEQAALELKDSLFDWLDKVHQEELPQLTPEEKALFEKLDFEELDKMFRELLEEQDEEHHGGSKWIGTGGRSPFGHSGAPRPGFRIGGESRNRRALQVAQERKYRDYRNDRSLDVRQYAVALRKLRQFGRDEGAEELDIDATIEATTRHGGHLELVERRPRTPTMRVLLMMDVGGTMDPFVHQVEALFSAASQASHFREFRAFYFHNCVYGKVYRDARFRDPVLLNELFRTTDKTYRLVIVGDAMMAPYELLASKHSFFFGPPQEERGWDSLLWLRERYPHSVWLNPEPEKYWQGQTLREIRKLFPMFGLTLEGLDEAISALKG
jgi:uncharacterized protein with von Willebrand factor type A (vWA) domain